MAYQVNWTTEKKELAIEKITEFLEKHGIGECIQQSDDALIEAPDIFSDIADNILLEGEGIIYLEKD